MDICMYNIFASSFGTIEAHLGHESNIAKDILDSRRLHTIVILLLL